MIFRGLSIRSTVSIVTALLVSTLFVSMIPVSASTIPSVIGDWTISGVETYDGGLGTVTGNILVETGGKLVLNNLTLQMEGAYIEDLSITVEQGGTLFIYNSVVRSANDMYPFLFVYQDGSTGLISGSTVRNVGSPGSNSGLEIVGTASVSMKDSVIKQNFNGVIANGSSPQIDNCTISDGQGTGVLSINGARPVIKDSFITRFTQGTGIMLDQSDGEFRGNTIASNFDGLRLYNSQIMSEGDVIRNNIRDGIHAQTSAANIIGSEVLENGQDGVQSLASSIVMDRTNVTSNGANGLLVQGSTLLARDLVIKDSTEKDLYLLGNGSSSKSHVTLINTTFSTKDFSDPNPSSSLEVYWYVSLSAVYESDQGPVPWASVWLTDVNGKVSDTFHTGTDGNFGPSMQLSYSETNSKIISNSPYVLTIEKGNEKQVANIDITNSGADLSLVFDDVSPAISLDPFDNVTSAPYIELSGQVTRDTTEIWFNDIEGTVDDGAFVANLSLLPGKNDIGIQAIDHVNNTRSMDIQVIRDIIPPNLIIISPLSIGDAPIYTNHGFVTISGQTEPASTLTVNGINVNLNDDGSFSGLWDLTVDQNIFNIDAKDHAGNMASVSLVVIYDPTSPILEMDPMVKSTNQETLAVSGSVDVPGTDVTMTLNGETTDLVLSDTYFTINVKLQEGTNQITVRATDPAGNEAIFNHVVILDTISPQLVLDTPFDGAVVSSRTILVSGMTDENSYLTINDLGAYRDGLNFYNALDLVEGRNIIEVISRDDAGNTNIIRVSVFLDSTEPFIDIISPDDGFRTAGQKISIEGFISEEAGMTLNGNIMNVEDNFFKVTVDLIEGENLLLFEARDKAGNLGNRTISIIKDSVVDLEVYRVLWSSKDEYLISGRTDPDATLMIDGVPYTVKDSGFFMVTADVKEGTDFSIEVKDTMGNTNSIVVSAPANDPSIGVSGWNPMLFLVSIVMVVGVIGTVGGTERGKLFALFFLFVPLYSRMKKNTVLDHYTRGQIHGYIVANPGDHYNSIKQALKLNNGTLAYHLRVLEKEGIVKSKADGIYKRFYPAGMKVPEQSGTRLTEIQKIIIKRIKETPGVSQKEMARLVGVGPSTINYHIGILKSAGLVRSERRGMRIGYFLESLEDMPTPVKDRPGHRQRGRSGV